MFCAGTLCMLLFSTRYFRVIAAVYTPSIPITELLRRPGQKPNLFKVKITSDSEGPEFPEEEVGQMEDYGNSNGIRNSVYHFNTGNGNGEVADLLTAFLDRTAILEIMNHIRQMLYCGPEGWCGITCCSRAQPWMPSPQRLALIGRRRFKPKRCALACMPHCSTQCLLHYSRRPETSDITMQIQYPQETLETRKSRPIPLCRPSCMPLCLKECIIEPATICRPGCMPQCTPACVNFPPMMIKCQLPEACICPPGYVQCSDDTCCMRYRTMAIKYRNQIPTYIFDDANVTDSNVTVQNGETLVFSTASSENNEQIVHGLKKNGAVIYHPENKTAEIIYDDSHFFLNNMFQTTELVKEDGKFSNSSASTRVANTTSNSDRLANRTQG